MDRFFVKQENLQGEKVVLVGQQAHQINNVLRKKAGEHIIVLDNLGAEYEIELKTIEKKKVTGQIKEEREATGEPTVEITLYQSLLSREKFEWVLQKCTEVGVKRFVPIETSRSIVRKESINANKVNRWKQIIQEAAEQSGRGKIPELAQAANFKEAITKIDDFNYKFMMHPLRRSVSEASTQAEGEGLRRYLKDNKKNKRIALFVGPEGGFTEDEVQSAKYNNIVLINLGRRVLRTETAAMVTSSLILYELGEMES
jgi:16S rRNA (uracil1498-N3)-methyltransferase